ncbi:MAG: 50S ribosomal protein L18 [Candidatus Omnitrophica bacterium]|nr:50S ribosomal protein L18 [Candidatus Omnitrophota bacterium]
MSKISKKIALRIKRHKRIKTRMRGDAQRPRLVIRRSLKHFHGEVIDDTAARCLFSLSTTSKEIKQKVHSGGNIKAAAALGEIFSTKLKAKGFSRIVFDRAGYLYHGRVKAFADALRKGGLEF